MSGVRVNSIFLLLKKKRGISMSETIISKHVFNDNVILIDPGRILDNNNVHEMVDMITSAQSNSFKYIIIDMQNLEFISSAGVGSILGTVEVSRESGGDIIICNASPTILHIFEVLDLKDYLTFKNNSEEAKQFCSVEG